MGRFRDGFFHSHPPNFGLINSLGVFRFWNWTPDWIQQHINLDSSGSASCSLINVPSPGMCHFIAFVHACAVTLEHQQCLMLRLEMYLCQIRQCEERRKKVWGGGEAGADCSLFHDKLIQLQEGGLERLSYTTVLNEPWESTSTPERMVPPEHAWHLSGPFLPSFSTLGCWKKSCVHA